MYILGISALYHDSAAALIEDGLIVAAAQEERFTRKKADARIPQNAIQYCLHEARIEAKDIDAIVYYDNPILTLDRWVDNILSVGDYGVDVLKNGYDSVFRQKLWVNKLIEAIIPEYFEKGKEIVVANHHASHAASAFFPSPFDEAAIITIDGVGEWNTTTIGVGSKNTIRLLKEINYPHSLGLLYSAFTYFCGFRVNFGDYKLMGLAPYGEPKYEGIIRDNLIDIKKDGSFRLNLDYFDYQNGKAMTSDSFSKLFDGDRRLPEGKITKREMDLASSVQKVVEDVIVKLSRTAAKETGKRNLVMAGGVALNCVANGVLRREGTFDNIWVQPAAGDAGGALGCALLYYYNELGNNRRIDYETGQKGSFWGPCFSDNQIKLFIKKNSLKYEEYERNSVYYEKIAELIDKGNIIGLFQGRMEYGPRALGNRSIIGDPRDPQMQAKLNLSIKHRESFRPFAPAVLEEKCNEYFDMNYASPYMLFCADVKGHKDTEFSVIDELKNDIDMIKIINRKRSDIPAVTHVDYSARVQTVNEKDNEVFYRILKAFEKRTGCAVVINTSFNVRGEPIVCNPRDAYNCFMNTDMDVLVLGRFILYKKDQPAKNNRNDRYELD